mgnify:CR=1 FL=1
MINKILVELAANNSRNYKIELLRLHRNNGLLKDVIRLALDPFILFYIKKIPEYDHCSNELDLRSALIALEAIIERRITGNAAIQHLSDILSEVSEDDAEVIKKIINKDLRCGISNATVNVVWNNLIPVYPVMLASKFEQKLIDRLKYPVICEEKVDGGRFNAIIENGIVKFFTRSGNNFEIPNSEFVDAFLKLGKTFNYPVVIDGELVVAVDDWKLMSRKQGNGIFTKCIRGTISDKEASGIRAIIWDYIPVENFHREFWNETAINRFNDLSNRNLDDRYIRLIKTTIIHSYTEAEEIFGRYLEEGKEGIILKDCNGIWEAKRSKNWIKMKAENDIDCEVIGWVEGTGKYIGKLGSLQCRAGSVEFSVGSGFSDQQREEIGKDIIGKIITVKYNEVIFDKRTNKKSLFLPIFLSIRYDKDIADNL